MIYRIQLPEMLDECPGYWKNFVHDAEGNKNGNYEGIVTKIELEKAGGKFYGYMGYDYECTEGIEFESEEAATLFKLKWI